MIAVFTREVTDDLTSLVKQIDNVVGVSKKNPLAKKEQKTCAFVVLIAKDPKAAGAKLEKLAKTAKVKHTPLTVFEGVAGPPKYKIAKDAAVTVMGWSKGQVKFNRAFAAGDLKKGAGKVVADIKKLK